ncbi:chromosome segregation protein SMC [Limoniibacter endophyticus]|uniref:Chromosome partition protein Smc n=1 Tax=Limoniibacter endophyticus TaxID=1565040 RepID=A0A8J3DNQ9_9HYPH|nr:chromosome segregation protein SMC [Limoniibacter endophyticus]GHC71623.1 chromosome partition protein Smc [Limoniibacter endophyticus]
MKFSRLRLLGFKSFVEPAEFVIEGGLTGVVGPNGCGKSNLVEALRWVMGENSYKNMRASGMDDVIFSGSGTRPARNTAEVTLFLDNRDHTAPSAFNNADELQISRRIERESGSVYRINGKEVRAKDVQLLFADQSTGARSPSMVGQGRIGELIQAKPQARRALLEEAAGISGLHSRRHEAELRLRAAEGNLERLEDVVSELTSQIESLKRQARQAARYKNLSAEIRQAEAILLHLRWTQTKAAEAEAKSQFSQAMITAVERATQQMDAAKAQAIGAHGLPALREAEAAAGAAAQRLSIEATQIEEHGRRLAARQREIALRLEQLDADIRREEQLVRDNVETLARLEREEVELREENASAADTESEMRERVEDAARILEESEAALAQLTAERAEAAAVQSSSERTLRDAGDRRERLTRQLAEVDRELTEILARLGELPGLDVARESVEVADNHLAETLERIGEAEIAVEEARAAENGLRGPLQEARSTLAGIETEARTLARMLSAVAGDGVAPVVEAIRVERGYEMALGAALGEDLDLPTERTAPAHWADAIISADDPTLPEGVTPLATVVTAPRELARRLRQIGLVEEVDGPRLQALLKVGQRLVSREGALWRWDGLTASADAPTPAAIRLSQKNRLAELEHEAFAAREAVSAAEAALVSAQRLVRETTEAERQARQDARTAQIALDDARSEFARIERANGDLASRRDARQDARARLADDLEEAIEATEEAKASLEEAPDLSELQVRLEQQSDTVSRQRSALADARSRFEGLRREAELRHRRLAAIAQERDSWKTRAANADSHIEGLKERREDAAEEAERLAEEPEEIDARRRAVLSELAKAESARTDAKNRLQATENKQAILDKAAQAAMLALAQAREERVRAEERQAAAATRREEVEARIAEAMSIAPHLVIQHTGLGPEDVMPDAAEIERQLERLKIERERLGAVNLLAEQEQKELSDRHDAITSDRDDVIEAIRTLRQAIQSLNKEGRERLLAAFDVVDQQFRRLFTHLFGGGTAELQLIESDDPLEAGLEILARPPGKKPQTMTLLSGGEQALTAMALIFAVFLTNPAPICVLDEVDAPLDDHNVERYCNLMDEMARTTETRFVIITHNPITMARMNRLFGVTMAEQGVSQLVSVDLQEAERIREAG